MKKNFMMTAAMAAVLVSSCSKNEQIAALPHDAVSSLVGLDIATGITKTATSDLQSGVKISYFDGTSGTSKEITFSYNSGAWAQAGSEKVDWSILGDGKTFYAMHDGSNPMALTTTANNASVSEITQSPGALPTVDYVFYAEHITAIPTGGDIQANFSHATSKVNIAYNVSNGNGSYTSPKAYVRQVKVNNFATKATPTFTAENTNTVRWALSTTKVNSAFPYISSLQAIPGSFDLTATGYLFPQAVTGTDPVEGVLPDADAAFAKEHVEVLYRFMDGGTNIVGFNTVQDYMDAFPESTADFDGYSGALYVKIGYVFPGAGYRFDSNTQYTLNLNLPGGYVISDKFYKENGEETNVTVVSPDAAHPDVDPELPGGGGPGLNPGEPVIPSPEQVIGLQVIVETWNTSASNPDLN